MADDPRRAVLSQWRRVQETGVPLTSPPRAQLRTRRTSPSYLPAPPPPSVGRDAPSRALEPRASARAVHYALPTDRTRRGDTDDARKRPDRDRAQTNSQKGHIQDAYSRQREKQRDLERQLSRMMDAHRASNVTATSTIAYEELVSPARPVDLPPPVMMMQNQNHSVENLAFHTAIPRTGRRVAPREIMQELDDDFERSFHEHQQPMASNSDEHTASNAPSSRQQEQEDGSEARDAFDEDEAPPTSPPPVMDVRIQTASHPPFREELSSDLSDHTTPARSPPPSVSIDPLSHDVGAVYSVSSEYIPSISLTPPASPVHSREQTNGSASNPPIPLSRSPRAPVAPSKVVFPTWSIGLLAACVATGLSGLFMEEILQWSGLFLQTSPFTMSRMEQREMNRRLDLLQQELATFRAAASEIEQQSQRMVHEVRTHLATMKQERERHQRMISKEMEALRRYVQAVTNELVEDEKQEIRKRLLETIADTIVELPDDLDDADETVDSSSYPAIVNDKREPMVPADVIEIAISAAEGDAMALFEDVNEAELMVQIDAAVANQLPHPPLTEPVAPESTTAAPAIEKLPVVDSSTSLFSLELVALLAGVALIAGVVGWRVRRAHRRKRFVFHRKPAPFFQRFGISTTKPASFLQRLGVNATVFNAPMTSDESDVETVAFFRGESDGEATFDRSMSQSEDDFSEYSEYSEEQKEGDADDDDAFARSVGVSSNGDEYEFHPAEQSGDVLNHSDVESLDETPSSPVDEHPTPLAQNKNLRERLADDSPPVRRSPRIQTVRSHLSHMR